MFYLKILSVKPIFLRTALAPIAWGSTYLVMSELVPPDRPLFVAATRVLPAGLALVLVGLLVHGSGPRSRRFGAPRHVVVLGLFNFALFFPLLVVAAYRLPGGVAATFGGAQPVLVLVAGRLIAAEPFRARQLMIGVAAAVGVALVVLRPGAGIDPLGAIAAFGANISFALGVVLTRRFPKPPSRVAATGAQLIVAAVVLLPLALVVEGAPPRLDASNAVGLGYLSLVATGAAFMVWFEGVRRLPAAIPPLLGLANPLTAVTAGWLVLGQSLTPVQTIGVLTTITAIVHGSMTASRPHDAQPERPMRAVVHDADGCVDVRPGAPRRPAHLHSPSPGSVASGCTRYSTLRAALPEPRPDPCPAS